MNLAYRIPHWIAWLWLGWVIAWWLLALWHKPVRQRGAASFEIGHRVLLIAGFILFWGPQWLGPLNRRFYQPSAWLLWVSLALILAGFALSFWARFTLGANWSARIVLKKDHELIRRGPYARIRHPIYTGLLLALLGTVAVGCRWGDVAGFGLVFISLYIKARGEEKLLAPVFGESFSEHLRRTGLFLPRLRQS